MNRGGGDKRRTGGENRKEEVETKYIAAERGKKNKGYSYKSCKVGKMFSVSIKKSKMVLAPGIYFEILLQSRLVVIALYKNLLATGALILFGYSRYIFLPVNFFRVGRMMV